MNVFLSYSQADKEWADSLRAGLAKAGLRVASSLEDIDPGMNWHMEAGKALEEAEAMVILLSPDSVESPYVRAEIEYALSSPRFRDRLISVLIEDTDDVPWILRRQQFIRATKDVPATIRRIAAALLKSPATAHR